MTPSQTPQTRALRATPVAKALRFAAASASALMLFGMAADAGAVEAITVPWVPDNPSVPHSAYNGHRTIFKGIARDCSQTVLMEWDIDGDGTYEVSQTPPSNYDLGYAATLPNVAQDTIFLARLHVVCPDDGSEDFASYPVFVDADVPSKTSAETATPAQLAVMRNVALDDLMWHLHTRMIRENGATGIDLRGYLTIDWPSNSYRASVTGATSWTYGVNGHLPAYPPGSYTGPVPDPDWHTRNDERWNTSPYSETSMRALNFYFHNQVCSAIDATLESDNTIPGSADGIGCRDGVDNGGHASYIGAHHVGALSVALTELAGVETVTGETFEFETQQMTDYYCASFNTGTSGSNTGIFYGYRGGRNDASTNQWGFIALEAADLAGGPHGVAVNELCRARAAIGWHYNRLPSGGSCYQGGNNTCGINWDPSYQTSGGGLVVTGWLGFNNFTDGSTATPFSNVGIMLTEDSFLEDYEKSLEFLGTTTATPAMAPTGAPRCGTRMMATSLRTAAPAQSTPSTPPRRVCAPWFPRSPAWLAETGSGR